LKPKKKQSEGSRDVNSQEISKSQSANPGALSGLDLDREEPQSRFHDRRLVVEKSLFDCTEVAGT